MHAAYISQYSVPPCQHHTTLYTIPLNACRIHLSVQCPTLPTPHYAVHQLTHYIIHIAHRQYPDVSATYDAADVLHHRSTGDHLNGRIALTKRWVRRNSNMK